MGCVRPRIIPALAGNTRGAQRLGRAGTDHPRSRGEYSMTAPGVRVLPGSSPLSRGIQSDAGAFRPRRWIIPALAGNTAHPGRGCSTRPGSSPLSRGIQSYVMNIIRQSGIIPALAGNTGCCRYFLYESWDHPRSRGEYIMLSFGGPKPIGSSPLSRGIPPRPRAGLPQSRIIPALAGNTGWGTHLPPFRWDHPRSRGEYDRGFVEDLHRGGSSPLSRGIPPRRGSMIPSRGIIPALAGNTRQARHREDRGEDHPRSRGEYKRRAAPLVWQLGSSPLSRGIRAQAGQIPLRRGIIPALAGNTRFPMRRSRPPQDHPRSRGEYNGEIGILCPRMGSSPLSRGILTVGSRLLPGHRIIPALAGNTSGRECISPGVGDHPRSRGEYQSLRGRHSGQRGSSPLSREIRQLAAASMITGRIIPALAGNTWE